jgi:probable addiction module antidote protein
MMPALSRSPDQVCSQPRLHRQYPVHHAGTVSWTLFPRTEADIKNYLEAVFEDPMDRQMLIHTLGVVARARGMIKLSKDTGITRAGLYKALSPDGNPSFETVTKIVGAFGMRLSAEPA